MTETVLDYCHVMYVSIQCYSNLLCFCLFLYLSLSLLEKGDVVLMFPAAHTYCHTLARHNMYTIHTLWLHSPAGLMYAL